MDIKSTTTCDMCGDGTRGLPTLVKSDIDIRSRRFSLCLDHQDDAEAQDLTVKFPESNSLLISFVPRGTGLVEQTLVRGHGVTTRTLIAEVEADRNAEVHEVAVWK